MIEDLEKTRFRKRDLDKFRAIWRVLPNYIIKLIGPMILVQLE